MEADVAAGAIARKQHGLITAAQARESGITKREVQWRAASGRWTRLHPGVFAVSGTPETWERKVLAAVLFGGEGTVASHFAAAPLHRFPDVPKELVEITVPPGRQPRAAGVRVHRPAPLPAYERRVVDGIPVTSFARTLVDCSGRLSLGQLARALDAGLVRNDVTLWSVERTLRELKQAPGRHPSKLWTLLGERGVETELGESRPEMRLARLLASAGLPAPVQQHWVTVGGDRFRLDMAYPEALVAVEYDGWDAHRSRSAFDTDRRRDRILQLAGWTVLRFTSRTPDEEVVATLRSFVHQGA
jgi:hypothetical protein